MATLKEKINYITNQFSAGKPALTGEPSNEFLIGVINELSADDSNYNEFKDSIPAIHKAAMEEISQSTPDVKHVLVSSMLRNSGISTTLKDENVTQKPIFVEFLLDKADKEGNDVLNKEISELMSHAFDEKNKRIEVSSLLAITNKFITEGEVEENSVISRYVDSENFSGDEYAKFCGATLAFSKLQGSFDYDLTENQQSLLKESVAAIENFKNISLVEPDSNINALINEAEEKYSKSFYSNDLDVEAQLHKIRSEDNLEESAGMISGQDLGMSIKAALKEQAEKKAAQKEYDLMLTWEEKYNKYIKDTVDVRVMTTGDKFNKKFAHHGFAPATANLFGDSIVTCDKFGDPTATLWNISPLTGSMKLSRDVRYDDPTTGQKAFVIAALNARRQGWDKVFLNHPGPDIEAKAFIEHSVEAMINFGDYSFEQIKVPRRYQHVLDFVIQQQLTGSIKNDAKVSEELRTAAAVNPEKLDANANDNPAPSAARPTAPTDESSPANAPKPDNANQNEPVDQQADNPDTFIPNSFDEGIDFDVPKQTEDAPAPELDDFEKARLEELAAESDQHFDDSHLDDSQYVHDDQTYIPVNEGEEFNNHNFDQSSEITYVLPDELKNEHQASIEGDTTPTKPTGPRKIKFGS